MQKLIEMNVVSYTSEYSRVQRMNGSHQHPNREGVRRCSDPKYRESVDCPTTLVFGYCSDGVFSSNKNRE